MTAPSGRARARRPGDVRARLYVRAVIAAGCLVLLPSLRATLGSLPSSEWWMLASLTLISGCAAIRIPSAPANFSISDVFTLTGALAFGPAAGTVMVAVDSLAISARLAEAGLSRERILFNAAAPPLAMWAAAQIFFAISGLQPLSMQPLDLHVVAPWLLPFAAMYFVLNTFAIAVAIALHERAGVLAVWRAHFQNLWITFIGGAIGAAVVVYAMQLGTDGLGLLALPLLLAVILHFAYRNATGRVSDQLRHLAELNRLHLSTTEALAHAIDAKDAITHGHIRRVQVWALRVAEQMGLDDDVYAKGIEVAALLHDIGKLAIPEHILNKPGTLTAAEFDRMKTHAQVGAEILSEIEFPYPVVPIVRHHHENWDGSGYPDRLAGDAIPAGARILSVVDCYDALTSDRPYRRAMGHAEALALIEARAGAMYDPAVVAAFRAVCERKDFEHAAARSMPAPSPAQARLAAAARQDPSTDDEIRIALELGVSMSSAPVCSNPWQVAVEALMMLPAVSAAVVFAIDDVEQRLRPLCAAGVAADALGKIGISIGARLSGWVAATQQPMMNAEAALDLFDVPAESLRSAIAIPCAGADGARVVITMYSPQDAPFGAFHARLLTGVAAHIVSVQDALPKRPKRVKMPPAVAAVAAAPANAGLWAAL